MDTENANLNFDQQRLDKLHQLEEAGALLYPPEYDRKDTIQEIKARFESIGHEKSEGQVFTAGRLLTSGITGKRYLPTSETRMDGYNSIYGKTTSETKSLIFSTGSSTGVI